MRKRSYSVEAKSETQKILRFVSIEDLISVVEKFSRRVQISQSASMCSVLFENNLGYLFTMSLFVSK